MHHPDPESHRHHLLGTPRTRVQSPGPSSRSLSLLYRHQQHPIFLQSSGDLLCVSFSRSCCRWGDHYGYRYKLRIVRIRGGGVRPVRVLQWCPGPCSNPVYAPCGLRHSVPLRSGPFFLYCFMRSGFVFCSFWLLGLSISLRLFHSTLFLFSLFAGEYVTESCVQLHI